MPDAGEDVTESEFLGSITPRSESLAYMAIAMTSTALPGEVLLGQRPDTERWTSERRAAEALAEFRPRLGTAAEAIGRGGTPTPR